MVEFTFFLKGIIILVTFAVAINLLRFIMFLMIEYNIAFILSLILSIWGVGHLWK